MQARIKASLLAVLTLVSVISASGGERHFEKKFSVSPGGLLKLDTDVGSVTVTGGTGNEVSVVADLRGRQRDVDEFEITADQSGSTVEVRGRGRHGFSFFNFGSDMDIHYTISVPREYNLNLKTAGGDLNISSVKGDMRGGTSGGNIEIGSVEGPVELHTSGGNVHARSVSGELHMSTSGGEVRVADATGNVDVSTSGGNIELGGVDGTIKAETSGGDVRVKLKGANKGVYVETSGGNIEIQMAKSSSANIDASTSGGDVTCDLPITMSGKISDDRIRGSVNGGGATVHARTSGGDIRIRSME